MVDSKYILDKALEILRKIPLCDRCLGRLFASYGRGLTNEERGRSIKTLLAMELHRNLLETTNAGWVEEVAMNACYPISSFAKYYLNRSIECRSCYICSNRLDNLIYRLSVEAASKVRGFEAKTFVIGVKSGSAMESREREVALTYGLDCWESVDREVKREVGKRVQFLTGLKPSFKLYDILILIDLDNAEVSIEPQPIYLEGTYVKIGRYISQMKWIGRNGARKYKTSIEEACEPIMKIYEGTDFKLHAAGREDADARMLGDGRPLILEVKSPRKRYLRLDKVSNELSNEWVKIRIQSYTNRSRIPEIKGESLSKVYRLIIYSSEGFTENDLIRLSEEFNNREITQRTPTRVLRRRSDTIRTRRVHCVKGRVLSRYVAEVIVKCEGGLYVKELVTGDYGRTNPSFSSVLGKELITLFLDVLSCHSGSGE